MSRTTEWVGLAQLLSRSVWVRSTLCARIHGAAGSCLRGGQEPHLSVGEDPRHLSLLLLPIAPIHTLWHVYFVWPSKANLRKRTMPRRRFPSLSIARSIQKRSVHTP